MRTAGLALLALAGCGARTSVLGGREGVIDGVCMGEAGKPRVLVYTYENQWRHVSNLTARAVILGMCTSRGFSVSSTNDVFAINTNQLAQFDVVVFGVTSGMGLDDRAHKDLEAWVRAGGGIVGIHSASATEQDWPFYVDLIGPQFVAHAPGLFLGTVTIEPTNHPITAGLSAFPLTDEWYVFTTHPEDMPGVTPLLAIDESSITGYPPELRQGHHVIAWTNEKYSGRVFYTAAGHNPDSYTDPTFVEILGRGIEWSAQQR